MSISFESLFEFVTVNWSDQNKIKSLVGKSYVGKRNIRGLTGKELNQVSFYWGKERARETATIELDESGTITRVRTWDGTCWNTPGIPCVDTNQ